MCILTTLCKLTLCMPVGFRVRCATLNTSTVLLYHYPSRFRPSDDLTPLSVHLCEFCAACFTDANGLDRHVASGCPNDPFSSSLPAKDAAQLRASFSLGNNQLVDDENICDENIDEDIAPTPTPSHANNDVIRETRSTRKVDGRRAAKQKMDYVALAGGKKRGRKPKQKIKEDAKDYLSDAAASGTSADDAVETADEELSENLACKICGATFTERAKLHKHVWKHNRKRSHIW